MLLLQKLGGWNLLNTEENIHNLLKREKPISSAFSVQIYRAWEKQKDQVFPQIDGFLTAQPCCSEQLWMLGGWESMPGVLQPHKKQEMIQFTPLKKTIHKLVNWKNSNSCVSEVLSKGRMNCTLQDISILSCVRQLEPLLKT